MTEIERLARIEENVKSIKTMLERHEKMMFGNGQTGCTTRLKSLEDTASLNRDNIGRLFRSISGVKKSVYIASGAVMIFGFIIANKELFAHVLGFHP